MASPSLSTPPKNVVSNSMRSSGYEVEPPIRPQPTRMEMGLVPFPFLTSSAFSGSDYLPPPFKTYGKCTKNHGFKTSDGIVLDGCGEYMSTTTDQNDPSFLICDACGCHRSFHREHMIMQPVQPMHNVVDYSCPSGRSRGAPSLMPVPSSYYPLLPFPHMFSAFNPNGLPPQRINNNNRPIGSGSNRNKGKRHRSKLSDEQKEKMLDLAGRIGWKIQKNNDEMVMAFCNRIGVCKSTFKIWMQNNKKKHVSENNYLSGSHMSF